MSLYKGMNAETLEAEYNLTKRRGADSFAKVAENWLQRSSEHRAKTGAQVDLAYGDGEREKLDYFYSGNPNGPLLLYIHGGYWQRGDKACIALCLSLLSTRYIGCCNQLQFDSFSSYGANTTSNPQSNHLVFSSCRRVEIR